MRGKKGTTEKRILQAALELFVAKGYHGTSVTDITRKVGLSKGSLYTHFERKSDLVLNILEKYRIEVVEGLKKIIGEDQGDAISKLHKVMSFSAKFTVDNPNLIVFLNYMSEQLTSNPEFEFAIKNIYRQQRELITDIIRQGIRQGSLRKDQPPDMLALVFMALLDGALHHWIMNRYYHLDGVQFLRTMRRMFMDGVKR